MFFLQLFGHQDRQIFELAYLEAARAPYSWIRRLGKTVDRSTLQFVLQDRKYIDWHALSFLLPYSFEAASEIEVANAFGPQFAQALFATKVGKWSGPVPSGYGVHLVQVGDKQAGRLPALSDVRIEVRNEWLAERRAASKEEFYQDLKSRYRVIVEEAGVSPPVDVAP